MNSGNATDGTQRMSSIPKLYAPVQIAEILSVSLRTVRSWIRTGDLAHTRLGTGKRLIRVREEDLIAFLNHSYRPVQIAPREQENGRESLR